MTSAQGSRWITHKSHAIQRVFDAYLNHLSTLCQDKGTKSGDKAQIVGYIRNGVSPNF